MREEQRREAGCPARELCESSRFQGTKIGGVSNPTRYGRRSFISATSASLAAIAGAEQLAATVEAAQAAPQTAGGQDPDLIVVNAKVYTMDTRMPRAEAFAATGGRIVANAAKLLAEKGSGRALISVCAAGGQGVVAILER